MVQKNEQYDAILLSNLMCRLSAPAQCLQQFTESDHYLKSGGILVISSPNTWMAQYTDPANFLDGADSAETLAALGECLPGFELLHEEDLPFMIRNTGESTNTSSRRFRCGANCSTSLSGLLRFAG